MTKIKDGGQIGTLKNEPKVTEIKVGCDGQDISLYINDSSLTYLSIEEAMALRNELNDALKKAVGV